jgi:hypothetical protein
MRWAAQSTSGRSLSSSNVPVRPLEATSPLCCTRNDVSVRVGAGGDFTPVRLGQWAGGGGALEVTRRLTRMAATMMAMIMYRDSSTIATHPSRCRARADSFSHPPAGLTSVDCGSAGAREGGARADARAGRAGPGRVERGEYRWERRTRACLIRPSQELIHFSLLVTCNHPQSAMRVRSACVGRHLGGGILGADPREPPQPQREDEEPQQHRPRHLPPPAQRLPPLPLALRLPGVPLGQPGSPTLPFRCILVRLRTGRAPTALHLRWQ